MKQPVRVSTKIGAFAAKTHLSALLERVQQGEVIEITRRGMPVARLIPADAHSNQERVAAVEELKRFAKGRKLGGLSIRKMIEEGRRF